MNKKLSKKDKIGLARRKRGSYAFLWTEAKPHDCFNEYAKDCLIKILLVIWMIVITTYVVLK